MLYSGFGRINQSTKMIFFCAVHLCFPSTLRYVNLLLEALLVLFGWWAATSWSEYAVMHTTPCKHFFSARSCFSRCLNLGGCAHDLLICIWNISWVDCTRDRTLSAFAKSLAGSFSTIHVGLKSYETHSFEHWV